MKLLSCTGCVSEGQCERAASMRERMKGMHIRTVKFGCPIREDRFKPGQPVIFKTNVPLYDDEGGASEAYFKGYVIRQIVGKVFGFIKPDSLSCDGKDFVFEARANGYVKIPLARVKPDSAREAVSAAPCDWCGNHPQMGEACGKDLNYTPTGKCLAENTILSERGDKEGAR